MAHKFNGLPYHIGEAGSQTWMLRDRTARRSAARSAKVISIRSMDHLVDQDRQLSRRDPCHPIGNMITRSSSL